MEQAQNLKTLGIGTKEAVKLEAKKCIVDNFEIVLVEKAKAQKVEFYLKHPDKEELIKVSSIFVLRKRKDKEEIVSAASWINLDQDKLLQKDSALAICLRYYKANNLIEMIGKEVETKEDSMGYLAIKAY
jgi:hypothetical protein